MEDQNEDQTKLPYGDELVEEGNKVPSNHDDSTSAQEIDKINRNNSARSIIDIEENNNIN